MITVGPGIRICIFVSENMYDNVHTMRILFVYYRHHLGRYVPGSVYIGFLGGSSPPTQRDTG